MLRAATCYWRGAATLVALGYLTAWAPTAVAALRFTGVNLAGAEFGVSDNNVHLPGTFGTHYTYPTSAEVNYYVGKGMNTFRLPFRWERLQRTLGGALDATELSRMDAFVNYATTQGATVILEPHNFQRYNPAPSNFQSSSQGLVGTAVSNAHYADFWGRVAEHYRDNGRVIFNLMNEPNTMQTATLVTSHNAAIAKIREKGATNIIHVPGNQWTGAWAWNETWYNGPNATNMLNIVDPAKNVVFEVHQYFDYNSSGTAAYENDKQNPFQSIDLAQIGTNANPNGLNVGVERLTNFTNWLRQHDLRGFLGEFALPNNRFGSGSLSSGDMFNRDRIADEVLENTLDYIEANDDVWEGWAWWAAGPWWGGYMFSLEPSTLNNPTPQQEKAAMPYLVPHFATNVPVQPGDFNLDDVVDNDDLILWHMSVGRSGLDLAGDGDGNGFVDGADFLMWQANLGATLEAPPAHGVPEPSALLLASIAVATYRRAKRVNSSVGTSC